MKERSEFHAGRRIEMEVPPSAASFDFQQSKRVEVTFESQEDHEEESDLECRVDEVFKSTGTVFGLKRLFLLVLLVLVSVETVESVIAALASSWLLGGLYILTLGLGISALVTFALREYRASKQLARCVERQKDANRLLCSAQIGEAQQWLSPLFVLHEPQRVAEFKESIKPHHTDQEVLTLYQHTLLSAHDERAKAIINEHAATSAMLVALSPMALLDMLAVLWRGVHLVETLTQHYGMRLGYRSRFVLYKLLFKQIIFAGAAELMSDLAATSLSAELLTKLSTRAAQGLSAGVFTARLGYKAMELCRPLPKLEKKPVLLQSTMESVLKMLLKRSETSNKG